MSASEARRNAEAIKDIAKMDIFDAGEMGKADLSNNYFKEQHYGKHGSEGALINPLSKSWLFEIVERESGKIKKSFTLVLPPQAYTIKEPQRVSITKTFGNAFVDDYGADNVQITLKGISGTAHAFPTFKTEGQSFNDSFGDISGSSSITSDGYNSKDAFYAFRDEIMRYKNKSGWDKNELKVYDLADEQLYKCILLDFSLDRQSGDPLRYPFTISLFVYNTPETQKTKAKPINISEYPSTATDKQLTLMDKLDEKYQGLQNIIGGVAMVKAKTLELRSRWDTALSQTSSLLTSPLDMAKNVIDTIFALAGIAKDTYDAGYYTLERYMGASEMIRESLNNGLRVYGYQISSGWQTSKTLSLPIDKGIEIDSDGNTSRASESTSYTYSGLTAYTITGMDTLATIALSELGDATLWPYIAEINEGISSNDDLVPGDTLFIPVETEITEGEGKESFILSEDSSRDPYGSDIQIDSNGNLVIQENGDFAKVSGIENIKQAINLRLNTEIGSLIKQSAYGIAAQAGFAGTDMALKYMKMAIRATVTQDPRIESVENIKIRLASDALTLGMNINIVGYEKSIPLELGD